MIEVLFLRHAPTTWNADGRIQGRADIPLSTEGEATALQWSVPAWAAGWPCLSSPLARAMATAGAMGLQPVAAPALIEMDWGKLEGRRLPDIRDELGEAFAAEEAKGLDFRPPGGESPREVGTRAVAALGLLSSHGIVVSHKGVLRALYALATGWDMRSKPPEKLLDGCCHRFGLEKGGGLRLVAANIPLTDAVGSSLAIAPEKGLP